MEKIKVRQGSNELKEVREYVRSLGSNRVPYYDVWGNSKGSKLLPLYHSDSLKFCYPDEYFSKDQIDTIVEKVKNFINEKNYDVEVECEDNY